MSDQCKYCTLKGDYEGCLATPCFQHESWFAKEQAEEIKRLKDLLLELTYEPKITLEDAK